ncbi:hypothetical protein HPB48_010874 [Haemaphysalis longicornis]|uniref:Uncharacterized protein n=1 Tax=Haemaphysalis longicornis TaxID=44386 RepID=A0A9J6G7U9_HAELO|nr:hypothetical protein HPB48_010874 [Haemaphysalis longicornis]
MLCIVQLRFRPRVSLQTTPSLAQQQLQKQIPHFTARWPRRAKAVAASSVCRRVDTRIRGPMFHSFVLVQNRTKKDRHDTDGNRGRADGVREADADGVPVGWHVVPAWGLLCPGTATLPRAGGRCSTPPLLPTSPCFSALCTLESDTSTLEDGEHLAQDRGLCFCPVQRRKSHAPKQKREYASRAEVELKNELLATATLSSASADCQVESAAERKCATSSV